MNIRDKNIVLITSKIIISNNPFSYCKIRSTYTTKQRFMQTIQTIKSVRLYIPNSYIVIIDNSCLPKNQSTVLHNLTDLFINIIDDKILNDNTNINPLKIIAEQSQQLCFYEHFIKKINVLEIKNFYKISGRYFINNTFNYTDINNDLTIFKKNENVKDRDYYYTSFYKLNKHIVLDYFDKLQHILHNSDFEVIVPSIIQDKHIVNHLGITQLISINVKGDSDNI